MGTPTKSLPLSGAALQGRDAKSANFVSGESMRKRKRRACGKHGKVAAQPTDEVFFLYPVHRKCE